MNCDQAKEVEPAIMDKMVGHIRRSKVLIQTLCSSYCQGQGQAARWKTAGRRSPGSVQQAKANFDSTSFNSRRWRWAANIIIDKDHGI